MMLFARPSLSMRGMGDYPYDWYMYIFFRYVASCTVPAYVTHQHMLTATPCASGWGAASSGPISSNTWQCRFDTDICEKGGRGAHKCYARCCRFRKVMVGNEPTELEALQTSLLQMAQEDPVQGAVSKAQHAANTTLEKSEEVQAKVTAKAVALKAEAEAFMGEKLEEAKNFALDAANKVEDKIKEQGDKIKNSAAGKVVSAGVQKIDGLLKKLSPGGIAELMIWMDTQKKKINKKIAQVADKLAEKVEPIMDWITEKLLGLLQGALNALPNNAVGKKIKGMVNDAISTFVNGILGEATETLMRLVYDLADKAVDLVFAVFEKGKEAIEKMMAKVKSMVEGFIGSLTGKINSVAGGFFTKFERMFAGKKGKWYFKMLPKEFVDNFSYNLRVMISGVCLKINTKIFDSAMGAFGFHQLSFDNMPLPGPIPSCDGMPYTFPTGWKAPLEEVTQETEMVSLESHMAVGTDLKLNEGLQGILGDELLQVDSQEQFVGSLVKGAKKLAKKGIAKLLKMIPIPSKKDFATDCLVGQKRRVKPEPARESVEDFKFWSFDDAGSKCMTYSTPSKKQPGGVTSAVAACPAGFTMMSGGLTLNGAQVKGTVVDAPSASRSNAWECSITSGVENAQAGKQDVSLLEVESEEGFGAIKKGAKKLLKKVTGKGSLAELTGKSDKKVETHTKFTCSVRCCNFAASHPRGMLRNRPTEQCIHPEKPPTGAHLLHCQYYVACTTCNPLCQALYNISS